MKMYFYSSVSSLLLCCLTQYPLTDEIKKRGKAIFFPLSIRGLRIYARFFAKLWATWIRERLAAWLPGLQFPGPDVLKTAYPKK